MPLPEFDPEDCVVVLDVEARSLRPLFPEEALLHATAWAVPTDDAGEPKTEQAYGSVDWTLVGYGAAVDVGCPPFEVAAPHHDLRILHETLFDERGNLRKELGIFGGFGNDLLLIDRMDVASGQDFRAVVGELLEHLLAYFTNGCFAVAYIDDPEPKPAVRQLLLEHGFRWYPEEGWGFFLLDLSFRHAAQKRKRPTTDPSIQ